MPQPISESDRSSFNPSPSFATALDCNPELASCNAVESHSPEVPRSVTIDPVYVTGAADSAARELVRRYDASAPARCATEQSNAAISCGLAAVSAASTAAAAPSVVALFLAGSATLGAAVQCVRDISIVRDCDERSKAIANAEVDCATSNGVLLSGPSSELICLVVR
jgi:hypothetical protein